jgi:5-methylcytosine-specific restriction endonuclease McrA
MNYVYRFTSYIYHKVWKQSKQLEPKIKSTKRKKTIPKTIRNQVWRKYCGNKLDAKCFCCDQELAYECWEAGHVIAEANGGNTDIENLRPVCMSCNRSMGKTNMFEFMKEYNMKGIKNLKVK